MHTVAVFVMMWHFKFKQIYSFVLLSLDILNDSEYVWIVGWCLFSSVANFLQKVSIRNMFLFGNLRSIFQRIEDGDVLVLIPLLKKPLMMVTIDFLLNLVRNFYS